MPQIENYCSLIRKINSLKFTFFQISFFLLLLSPFFPDTLSMLAITITIIMIIIIVRLFVKLRSTKKNL